jgi:thiol-disulfide isomerase/thioredoxin
VTRAIFQLPPAGYAPPFTGGTEWLNSPPLTPEKLRGKVVLVSFWTYTCINWLRTLPYLRAWAHKYKKDGLVVVGVHTPEFSYEHNIDNIQQAIKAMKITYPVVVDNGYEIWSAFDNHFWPALYFVDAEGRIRYHQFGEGEYEMAEHVIQQLLAESSTKNISDDLAPVKPKGIELAADWNNLQSPETYLGYGRNLYFASPNQIAIGRRQSYDAIDELRLNQWSLAGDWSVDEEGAFAHGRAAKILFSFHARDLNLVMGPVMRGMKARFKVLVDGRKPGRAAGVDLDAQGNGTVVEQRLYQLVRQLGPISDRLFTIEFQDPAVAAYVFTFG